MKIQDFQDNVTCGGFDNIFANIYKPQDIDCLLYTSPSPRD